MLYPTYLTYTVAVWK